MKMNFTVPPAALDVCLQLQGDGHDAYLVGGCVRDSVLGREPKDWDVATNAMPSVIQSLFDRVLPTDIKHGTVTVMMDGEHIEVTTFRTEGEYSDSRRPDTVQLGVTLKDDLSRRDFTMNAMAYDPISDNLIDPFNGRRDLADGVIRCVGKTELRFTEDGLRIMRALRFHATLGLRLDDDVAGGIRTCLASLRGVSGERFRDELLKLLGAPAPSGALRIAMETGVLDTFIPELRASVDHSQNQWHKLDVWEHTLVTVDNTAGDPVCRMGALLHDVAKPASAKPAYGPGQFSFIDHGKMGAEMAATIMERLKFSNKDKDRVVGMVRHHMALFGYNEDTTDKALRKILKKTGNLLPDILALTMADIIGKDTGEDPEERLPQLRERLWKVMSEIASGKAAFSTNQLAINGRDVMDELGIKPGKEVGVILKTLLDQVMDNPELNDREVLLKLLPEVRC